MRAIQTCVIGVLFGLSALSGACGKDGNPVGPSPAPVQPPPAPNALPSIQELSVRASGYRTARLTGRTSDSDGQVSRVVIDWGDGSSDTVTNGFENITRTHRYGRAQAYTVTLRATDDEGATNQDTRSVTIRVPPEACLGIAVLEVCGQVTADFNRIHVAVKAGDIVLTSFNLVNGRASTTFPIVGGFGAGTMTVSFDFNTGRLRFRGSYCDFTGCKPFDRTIQLG